MNDKTVKMIQVSKHRWDLVSPKGTVLTEGIILDSPFKAEEWVKSYISSYTGWSYEIMTKKVDK